LRTGASRKPAAISGQSESATSMLPLSNAAGIRAFHSSCARSSTSGCVDRNARPSAGSVWKRVLHEYAIRSRPSSPAAARLASAAA
jgi:hypothetical protein